MIKLLTLITENRVDDFNKKYSSIPDDVKTVLIKDDPSDNHKYLDWMGKIVSSEKELDVDSFIKDVEQFNKFQSALGDIYKLKSYSDLKTSLASREKSKKEVKKEGAEVLIDDKDFLVVAPENQDSCAYYGNNTRWCIINQEKYWNQYYYENSIIILLDRRHNQKYAIIGNSYGGKYDVYDKNDHRLDYSAFSDRDDEYGWPEYVHEAIYDYVESDDPEKRKLDYHSTLVDEFIKNEGLDTVWKNYLKSVNDYFDIDDEDSDISLFRSIAKQEGLTDEDVNQYAIGYLYHQIMNDNIDNMGEVWTPNEFDNYLKETGEEKTFKPIINNYVVVKKGTSDSLNIIRNAVGESKYNELFNNYDLEKSLSDAVSKYNEMINTKYQLSLKGIEHGKQSVRITNIKNIIYIFKKTGYESLAFYLENALGLKESKRIKLSTLIKEIEDKEQLKSEVERFEKQLRLDHPQLQDLDIYLSSNGSLYISSIRIKKEERGKGVGKQVIEKIKKFANDHNLVITLSPEPEPRYKEKLHRFYKDLGFVDNKGRKKDYRYASMFGSTMIRRPGVNEEGSVSDDPEKWKSLTKTWKPKINSGEKKEIYRDYTFVYFPSKNGNYIVVYDENEDVAGTLFFDPVWDINDDKIEGAVEVHPDHRRHGLATEMYKMAERLAGMKMKPSHPHSADAEAFWNQPNRPFGENTIKLKRLLLEARFGKKMILSIGNDRFVALMSHNTKTSIGEQPYRITIFDKDFTPLQPHVDITEDDVNYIITKQDIPDVPKKRIQTVVGSDKPMSVKFI